jgi:hypothetical protein
MMATPATIAMAIFGVDGIWLLPLRFAGALQLFIESRLSSHGATQQLRTCADKLLPNARFMMTIPPTPFRSGRSPLAKTMP